MESTPAAIPPEPHALPPKDWKQKHELVLASASPRRKALLESMGLKFNVIVSGIDEENVNAKNARELTEKLARMKAEAVLARSGDAFVIGSDSMVELEGKQIGKPKMTEQAREFFKMFSGKPQDIYTGICIIDAKSGKRICESIYSVLEFNKLSDAQIEKWLREGNPLELAGGYYIYEIMRRGFVKQILHTGADNVAGLPRTWLRAKLAEMGFYDS